MADGWVRAAAKADVAEGKVLGVKIAGRTSRFITYRREFCATITSAPTNTRCCPRVGWRMAASMSPARGAVRLPHRQGALDAADEDSRSLK